MVTSSGEDDDEARRPRRVLELAKRFESPSGAPQPPPRPAKRIGKFRVVDSAAVLRIPTQRARSGITRKRSSLKRRTQSTGDVNTNPGGVSSIWKSVSLPTDELLPTPRMRQKLPETNEVGRKDAQPTYHERVRVSFDIKTPPARRPQILPPPPPAVPTNPPSAERLKRIPSYLKPSPAPRNKTMTTSMHVPIQRPQIKSPPPPTRPVSDGSTTVPKLPTIPLPELPVASIDFGDECYEEIFGPEVVDNGESTPSSSSTLNSEHVAKVYCSYPSFSLECTKSISCECAKCRRRSSQQEEEVYDEAEPEVPQVKPRFLSTTLRGAKSSRRPVSTLEFEKLFRFKSELQLNLSKKVCQLRQKVGERHQRRAPKFQLSADALETDYPKRRPEDDQFIYGDDWSSDDEQDDRRSSMYEQLEEQLNKAFPAYASSQMSEYESADFGNDDEPGECQRARPAIGSLTLNDDEPSSHTDEPSPDDADYTRQYTCRLLPNDQPLYQHYILAAQEKIIEHVLATEDDSAVIAQIAKEKKMKSRRESSASSDSGRGADCSTSTSALTSNTSMRRDRLVGASNFGSQRSLWCELPEVKAAGLLESLDDESKIQQEAYFEVITSEASYLRSLNILITHFMASPQMLGSKSTLSVISNSDRKHLFSNIFAVRDCSERLLCDLETRLEENLVLDDICDILTQHFETHFEVYVKYCSNQVYQDRTLRRLKSENPGFLSASQRLEEHRQCQGLDMRSFLMLPMQRITRYPLLLYAIIDRLQPDSERYKTAAQALSSSNRVVRECNEGARRMERTEQLLEIDRRLIYKDSDLKRIPLVSNSRYLVKRGVLTQLVERKSSGLLQSRQKSRTLYVFLFSDLIMITKKKLNGTYICKDYAARRFVDVEPIEPDNPKIPVGAVSSIVGRPHLFLCVLMRNARGRQTELLLTAESETDRERWLSAIRPPTSANPEEKVYAEWDCPQAVALHVYSPCQQDELSLQVGDTVNILRKMPDGWLYGERVADGVGGWFPSSYVQSIVNDHTRANNYRQRLRIVQAAAGWRGNVSSAAGRGRNPLMDRLRRMSNPKSFFTTGAVGL